jgi:hypothetical protein
VLRCGPSSSGSRTPLLMRRPHSCRRPTPRRPSWLSGSSSSERGCSVLRCPITSGRGMRERRRREVPPSSVSRRRGVSKQLVLYRDDGERGPLDSCPRWSVGTNQWSVLRPDARAAAVVGSREVPLPRAGCGAADNPGPIGDTAGRQALDDPQAALLPGRPSRRPSCFSSACSMPARPF